MAIAKKPRKLKNKLSSGAGSLSLNHQGQLAKARARIKGRDFFTEGWAKTAAALNEAARSVEDQTRRD